MIDDRGCAIGVGRFEDGSIEQRMLLAISAELSARFRPRPLLLENRNRVEVEGIDSDGRIVVQLVTMLVVVAAGA